MRKSIILFYLLLALPFAGFADGNQALFDAANELYSNGDFIECIDAYERILQTRQESAEVYYNLGNSYFKTNQLSLSILNYERGLLLQPGDEDILYNLTIANELIIDKIEALPEFFLKTWYRSSRSLLSSNSWALTSLFSFLISCLMIVSFFLHRKKGIKRLLFPIVILGLILSILSLAMSIQQSRLITDRNTCIVFAETITIKSSPDDSGTNLFVLHEGLKLEITDRLTGWYEIKLADGNVGWITIDAVELI